ncbi:MAG: NAD/NADP octopine/nopaline dehydrogenase family protein [Candidatus Limimorpha sp.]
MTDIKNICICGGSATGHVLSGYISHYSQTVVNILTSKPGQWSDTLTINLPDGSDIHAGLGIITDNPDEVIPDSDIVILCLPGFAIRDTIIKIKPFLRPGTFVGTIVSSTGFFFEAMRLLDSRNPLFGFQRVPFISRIKKYGSEANLMGFKNSLNIAVERCDNRYDIIDYFHDIFKVPVNLLENFYEASFTNSNPILHTARLYSIFKNWHEGLFFERNIAFYEEWDDESSELLITMDAEFFEVMSKLPVRKNYLPTLLEYYESHDAQSLTHKISSIQSFKGILSPMKKVANGWIPDLKSRYFTEDFPYGLRFIFEKAKEFGIYTPNINTVLHWGMNLISQQA